TTERFDETLILLQKTLGWRIPFYTRANVSKNRAAREELSPAALETIKKFNELDIELYDYVQALLDEQINRQPFNVNRRTRNFARLNQLYGFGYRSCRALARRIKVVMK
ncbi:MAG TPA: hypothetical protein ENK32_03505, partial [Anaerolineae bacterium]|nr:hypothetical protein [Anaerolineae bacterium]